MSSPDGPDHRSRLSQVSRYELAHLWQHLRVGCGAVDAYQPADFISTIIRTIVPVD